MAGVLDPGIPPIAIARSDARSSFGPMKKALISFKNRAACNHATSKRYACWAKSPLNVPGHRGHLMSFYNGTYLTCNTVHRQRDYPHLPNNVRRISHLSTAPATGKRKISTRRSAVDFSNQQSFPTQPPMIPKVAQCPSAWCECDVQWRPRVVTT